VYIFSFAIGACIGSFLNVCIYRLPREMSIVSPPSHCPACGQPLAWHDNVPIISFLLLGGRCRHCGVIISGRYALVEAITGLLFVATVHSFVGAGTLTPVRAAAVLIVASALVAGSFIDIERRIIPDEITLPGTVLGCLAGLLFPHLHDAGDPVLKLVYGPLPLPAWGLAASVFGALVGGGFIYLSGVLGRIIFRKEAMGMGDVKLMAMVGRETDGDGGCLPGMEDGAGGHFPRVPVWRRAGRGAHRSAAPKGYPHPLRALPCPGGAFGRFLRGPACARASRVAAAARRRVIPLRMRVHFPTAGSVDTGQWRQV